MKLRRRLFGYRIRDVDQRFARLRDEVSYKDQDIDRVLMDGRARLQEQFAEEERLWQEIVACNNRIRAVQSGEAPAGAAYEEPKVVPRLGELLIGTGAITEEQLAQAIEYQHLHGGRLGDTLVELGFITVDVLAEAVLQMQPRKLRLGDLLLQHGLISKEQLEQALAFQRSSGGMLGDIVTSLRLVEPEQLYRLIATQAGVGRVGSREIQDDIPKLPEALARSLDAVVIGDRPTRYLVAVGDILKAEDARELENRLGKPIEQVLATREELERFWAAVYTDELMEHSTNALLHEQPENSAHVTFTRGQLAAGIVLFVVLSVCLFLNWLVTLIVLNCIVQVFYLVMTLFKFWIIMKGARRNAQLRFTEEELRLIDEKKLPIYTILVPMYKEANIIPDLLHNLEQLDYPKAKLDIRLLIEEDDVEAKDVLESMQLPPYYTTIVVPHSLPKTKPKACNYGLIRARGEYVVIYDAEDRPDPDQLKKVYAAFCQLPEEFVCVQAKLNYFNSEQNLLTRWFTHEYSMWFELLLPGVMQLDVPIPLGGTSNHFKMKALKQINAWDPYNVTEDADLGIRLYKEGFKTAIVDSRTWEEANSRVGNWIRQRSRWIKGYMQTWLVHMRNPVRLWREIGPKGFWGFQVMVLATPVLPLLNPIFWLMLVLWYGWELAFIPAFFPGPIYYFSALMFLAGNFLFVFSHAAGMYAVVHDMHGKGDRRFSYGLVKYTLLTPVYWVLMSLAAVKAAWQLVTKPFYWEKTTHGLSGSRANAGQDGGLPV